MKIVKFESFRSLRKIVGLVLSILLMSTVLMACSKDDGGQPQESDITSAKSIIKEMGPGFNVGNCFDNGIKSTDPATIKPIIDLYYEAGMKHVRIPVTWGEGSGALADASGNVDFSKSKFTQLKTVIDYALDLGLYVVINTHHEHWLKDYYDGSAALDTRFKTIWTDIATYFKDYDHHLIFEVLNEPEGMLGENNSSVYPSPLKASSLENTRKVNKIGYDAIRATGGKNATRVIMVSTNAQGNSQYLDDVYPTKADLPGEGADTHLAIQVHSYDPWSFCGQTGSNSAYPGNAGVQGAIHPVIQHAITLGVPLNYGEFGVGRDGNEEERNTDLVRGYYKTFANKVLLENMSFSVWDDRGWFGLVYESGANNYQFTNNIVPYMLGNE